MKEGKQLGELAEQMFAVEVLKRGGIPSKPVGDSSPYDWIVHAGGKFHRVQVKSSWMGVLTRNGVRSVKRCRVNIAAGNNSKVAYTKATIDFIAVWLDPFQSWLIKPASKLGSKKTMQARRTDCESPSWSLLGLA